jgi:hypothetical protein
MEHIWCTKCRTKGHHKDECPTFAQYLAAGAPNPLPGGGYYEICKKWGHNPHECQLLQKYQHTPRSLFCSFCKSVGHEDKYFHAFDIMREHTTDMYKIQRRMLQQKEEGSIILQEDLIKETEEDSVGVEVEQTLGEEEEAHSML